MEETRELAAVSQHLDFTNRFVSAYNKFTYVASAGIFICAFELSQSNSFFGIKVGQVNERWVETTFFFAGLVLGWNYLTRVLDERKVLSNLEVEIIKSVSSLNDQLRKGEKANGKIVDMMNTLDKSLDQYSEIMRARQVEVTDLAMKNKGIRNVDEQEVQLSKIVDGISHSGVSLESANNLRYFFTDIPNSIEKLKSDIDKIAKHINSENDSINKIPEKITSLRIRKFWPQVRYWSIDITVPLGLLCFLTWSYLSPNEINPIMDWFGKTMILN